MLTFCKFG